MRTCVPIPSPADKRVTAPAPPIVRRRALQNGAKCPANRTMRNPDLSHRPLSLREAGQRPFPAVCERKEPAGERRRKSPFPQRIALFPHIGTCLPVGLLRQDPAVRLDTELDECPQYMQKNFIFHSFGRDGEAWVQRSIPVEFPSLRKNIAPSPPKTPSPLGRSFGGLRFSGRLRKAFRRSPDQSSRQRAPPHGARAHRRGRTRRPGPPCPSRTS